ncbi:MAG: NAD(P)/FAD-dependent oxidoreductase, partial [Ornithinibacter sp.]
MTETLQRPAADAASAPERADAWLSAFEEALTARDVDRAAAMFAAQSWWRDLVSFSWNITTVEHPEG